MADVTGMFRRGEISSRQAGKLGILKQTRVNRPNEEEFHGKQGRRDQGRGREHGAREATTRHMGLGRPPHHRPSPGAIEEARRIYAEPGDLTAELMGDPRPGRSALDRMNQLHPARRDEAREQTGKANP